jgi:hypothetical protein
MGKKTIKGLLEELAECNKELERFTEKSEKVETVRKLTKPSFTARLQRIQEFAKSLHSTITSSWSCSCRSNHRTSLQLEQREHLYVSASKRQKLSSKICFTVSFTTFGDAVYPWTWQEAEIQIAEEDTHACTPQLTPVPKPRLVVVIRVWIEPC